MDVIRYPRPGNKVDTRRPWYVWFNRDTDVVARRVQIRNSDLDIVFDTLLNSVGGQTTYREGVRIPGDIAVSGGVTYTVRGQSYGTTLSAWSSGTETEGEFVVDDADAMRPILTLVAWKDLQ